MVVQRHHTWRNIGEQTITITVRGRPLQVRQTFLRSPQTNLLVWHWYWLAGTYSSNPYMAKLVEVKNRLLKQRSDAAAIVIATDYNGSLTVAAERLQQLINDMLPSIETRLEAASRS
jgi:EpsI family protein